MGTPIYSTSVDTPITVLPEGYKPSANEEFMNDRQREYFRQKLLAWRAELIDEAGRPLLICQRKAYTNLTRWIGRR